MSTYPISDSIPSLTLQPPEAASSKSASKLQSDFGEFLSHSIDKVNSAQLEGDIAIEKLQTGKAQHLHEVMIAVEEADISLRMLVQMRNKAQQAYEEIMRLQL